MFWLYPGHGATNAVKGSSEALSLMLWIGMDPSDFSLRPRVIFLPPVQLSDILVTPVLMDGPDFTIVTITTPVTYREMKTLRQSPSAGVRVFFHARQRHLIRIGLQELLAVYLGHGLILY